MKAILVKDEMCDKWLNEDCDHEDCAFAQIEPLPNSTAHPDCPLPDWPELTRDDIRELLCLRDEPLRSGIDRAINKLRSIGVIVKEEKVPHD